MQIPRVYFNGTLSIDEEILLSEQSSHHLINVLRLKLGAMLVVFNGEGGEFNAEVVAVQKKNITVKLDAFKEISNESPLKIELAQGISRGDRMDYTIQKAVELGVTQITPLFTERCGVKLKGERLQKRMLHWQAVIVGACEQSGRCVLPKLNAPLTLSEWLYQAKAEVKFLCDPQAQMKLADFAAVGSAVLLMGPEGGLSEAEVAEAIGAGFVGLSLGPRVLRTETAGLVGVALLQGAWGDL